MKISIEKIVSSPNSELQRHSDYQMILLKKGEIRHNIDFDYIETKAPYASLVFPN